MARKRKNSSIPYPIRSILINEILWNKVQKIAQSESLSASAWIRNLVSKHVNMREAMQLECENQ